MARALPRTTCAKPFLGMCRAPHRNGVASWAKEAVEGGDIDAVLNFQHTAPAALRAHPRTEHFAPLFVALGATADAGVHATSAIDGFWFGMAKRSFEFN